MERSFSTLKKLSPFSDRYYHPLSTIEDRGWGEIRRLPISIRIMLESLLRHCDGVRVKPQDVQQLASWGTRTDSKSAIPFVVARVILQDFTGVPLLVDLAAMRDAAAQLGLDPCIIEPQVPVDLVVDHSVQVDRAGTSDAFTYNLELEFERNKERYAFLKWGQKAFKTLRVVPPGIGIVHQVNLEYFATLVSEQKIPEGMVLYPDTLVGTDSHTTMVNGLGVLGWGVGGIEAEAAMLGQPVYMHSPEVVGFHLTHSLREGVTATDLTLRITEMLRKEKVVGKFVEFFGEGAASLSVADRATIGNMAPEYGATVGFFPPDEKTLDYLRMTGRSAFHIEQAHCYLEAQGLFGIPRAGEIDFSKILTLDLRQVVPCISGPKRPQDRIDLGQVKSRFEELLIAPVAQGGYGKSEEEKLAVCVHSTGAFSLKRFHECGGNFLLESSRPLPAWSEEEMVTNRPLTQAEVDPGYSDGLACDLILRDGTIVIAAITSCTNTSNPHVMIAAGLLAKKAVEKGLRINPLIKTSLAPGSRVVTDYLEAAELQPYLDLLGFQLTAYGCTTCIGNSGPLDEKIEHAIKQHGVIAASVLSGNRNFEARIHGAVKANFLMSPPLVVAYAIAGKVNIDIEKEPLGIDKEGNPVYLKDIWPSSDEIAHILSSSLKPALFKKRYAHIFAGLPVWEQVDTKEGARYDWDPQSSYIRRPPYFEEAPAEINGEWNLEMHPLALFGDSVTTDHISPAGAIDPKSPAGEYLLSLGVKERDFNSYGSRRGNHEVMLRGTFANVRLRNQMAGGKEGGHTLIMPEGKPATIFEASQIYSAKKIPLIIFAGKDYGMGSSRDWAAKGTALLGVKAVVARSFERIHRNNLLGMGVLPLLFQEGESWESLGISGKERFSLKSKIDPSSPLGLMPSESVILEIAGNGEKKSVELTVAIETPTEALYYSEGGILPYMLRSYNKKTRSTP